MNERQWWNGRWSRLARRDVFVRNAADGRWQVELRRGGPEGRLRTLSFGSRQDAVEWIESAVLDQETGWREVLARKPQATARKAKAAAQRPEVPAQPGVPAEPEAPAQLEASAQPEVGIQQSAVAAQKLEIVAARTPDVAGRKQENSALRREIPAEERAGAARQRGI